MRYAIFAKHLQDWPIATAVERVAKAGFDGLDLTVRPGGYVDPTAGDVGTALADAVKLARNAGLQVPLVTTAITTPDDPHAQPTIAAAGQQGIRELKLGYWPYDGPGEGRSLDRAVSAAKRALDGLERLARAAGVRLNIHNHSGDHLQNSPWVVADLLRDRDPAVVGCYFDPAHFTLEGGLSGWKHALELLSARVTLLAVKDGKWVDVGDSAMPAQERRWVPVGSGNVRWREVLPALRRAGFDGWASIHCEYQGRWTWKDLSSAEVLAQGVADRKVVESVLAG